MKYEMRGTIKYSRHKFLEFNLLAEKVKDLENVRLIIDDSSLKVKIKIKTDIKDGSVLFLPDIVCKDNSKVFVEIKTLPKTGMLKKIIEFKFSSKTDISEIRLQH